MSAIGGTGQKRDAAGFEGVGNGEDQPLGACRIGGGENIFLGGIADHGLDAVRLQPRHGLVGILDDQERLVGLSQGDADQAADPAITDQDGVAG